MTTCNLVSRGRIVILLLATGLSLGLRSSTLEPLALEPLPIGSVMPEGWLKYHLDLMTEGLVGRLYETSEYLRPDNGWLDPKGRGWEDQPYWFRSFVKLAVLTRNERCLAVSRDWIGKILATRDADGWFGPADRKERDFGEGRVLSDIWGHMVMCEALWSWFEYSGDTRVRDLIDAFLGFCATTPDERFIAWSDRTAGDWHFDIQRGRAGDLLPLVFRTYERTRDPRMIALADRLMKKCSPPQGMFLSDHNVQFAQRVAYWTLYSRRTHQPADRASADFWYDLHMAVWGQMPRGAFGGDEQVRVGCTDPRQGLETCSWAELTRSFNLLGDLTGETKWADRTEDVVFNHAPCAYTPDWKELHYITAPNQVNLDARTDHNYFNGPPQIAYSSKIYRCCRHNAALTFPLFTENLVKRSPDGALVFWMYAPHRGHAAIGGGEVSWMLETRYPFRETATLSIEAEKPSRLRFRVPGWARGFSVGAREAEKGASWLEVSVPAGKTVLPVVLRAVCAYTQWPRSGAVTVDRGPLSYSLAIGERYGRIRRPAIQGGSIIWAENDLAEGLPKDWMTEVTPLTAWNYGLDVSKPLEYRTRDWTDDCFVATNAVCEITAVARRVPGWTLQDNQPAALQGSPVYVTTPEERVRFVPLGCQRLRLSVLPRVTTDRSLGFDWKPVPAATKRADRPSRRPDVIH